MRNDGLSESDKLQNRFTAYLTVAVQRTRMRYFREIITRRNNELPLDCQDILITDSMDDLPLMSQLENQQLHLALTKLSRRDLDILLKKTLECKTHAEIADEIGLTVNSVSAINYRTLEKLKKGLKQP